MSNPFFRPTPENPGRMSGVDFTSSAIGKPVIKWRDITLQADVYALPGAPMEVHLMCPVCAATHGDRHMLRIRADRKQIDYDRSTGRLSVQGFRCTWEPDGQSAKFGINRCTWHVEIADNIARDI